MEVQMEHRLPAIRVRVHDDAVAAVGESGFPRQVPREGEQLAEQSGILRVVERREVMRGDHEDVRGCLWIEILEREHAVRPLHDGRRNLTRRDFTEDATSHAPRLSRSSSKGLAQLLPEFLSGMLFRRRLPLDLRELL